MADFDADGLAPEDSWPFGDMLPGGFDGVAFPGEFGAPEAIPPVITDFDPSLATTIASNATVAFSITDETGLFFVMAVLMKFESRGVYEVVHDGTAFGPQYFGNSTRVAVSGGFRYTLRRRDGWPEKLKVRVLAIDRGGNTAIVDSP